MPCIGGTIASACRSIKIMIKTGNYVYIATGTGAWPGFLKGFGFEVECL